MDDRYRTRDVAAHAAMDAMASLERADETAGWSVRGGGLMRDELEMSDREAWNWAVVLMGLMVVALLVALLWACAQVGQAVTTVCGDVARLPGPALAALDGQDPHSALGVIWADVKAGCANGVPAAGVSADWVGMVWGELKVLIPQALPSLLPILVGLV